MKFNLGDKVVVVHNGVDYSANPVGFVGYITEDGFDGSYRVTKDKEGLVGWCNWHMGYNLDFVEG